MSYNTQLDLLDSIPNSLNRMVQTPSLFKRTLDPKIAMQYENAQAVKAATQPRFPKLNNAVRSLTSMVVSIVTRNNAMKLATLLAAYPIVKLVLSIIAHFTVGAAISLPPVAAGLLIAAATLFLITLTFIIIKHRRCHPVKELAGYAFKTTVMFVAAPVTSLSIIGKEILHIGKKIQHKMRSPKSKTHSD